MPIPFYWVDAFTDSPFAGNPAGVCPLETWIDDATMQAIAAENGLSETAFLTVDETGAADYHLRWFTPTVEVDLCGHATLATGHVVLNHLQDGARRVTFRTRSGVLAVAREGGRLVMDFPSWPPAPRTVPDGLGATLGHPTGREPDAWLHAPQEPERDRVVAVYPSPADILDLAPDFAAMRRFEGFSVCVTAPGGGEPGGGAPGSEGGGGSPGGDGNERECGTPGSERSEREGHKPWQGAPVDFVSRYFAPNHGIDEDPVTGSNHSILIPYWAARLGKTDLTARQISARGGTLYCRLAGERVSIGGDAALYMRGEIGA